MQKEEYYLYFDDSGIRFPDKQQMVRSDGMDHFSLGGILIKKSDRSIVIEKYKELRKKWRITYPLRSSDMRGKRGNFVWLSDKTVHDEFFKDLNEFLCTIPVIGFAAVVDRGGYNKRYKEKYKDKRWWMCKTAFNVLIERTVKHVIHKNGLLHIRFEEGGKKEDRAIVEYLKDLKKTGMPFDASTSSKYSPVEAKDFRAVVLGDPRRQMKKSPLIQIADLYLYPMIKGGYDKEYPPYKMLMKENKLIDTHLSNETITTCGIKYSCFE
ncbi:MAG: hypothetical protein RLY66_303 [Candidatus Parcubacteria bacterium]|jgi:hypothetical protein